MIFPAAFLTYCVLQSIPVVFAGGKLLGIAHAALAIAAFVAVRERALAVATCAILSGIVAVSAALGDNTTMEALAIARHAVAVPFLLACVGTRWRDFTGWILFGLLINGISNGVQAIWSVQTAGDLFAEGRIIYHWADQNTIIGPPAIGSDAFGLAAVGFGFFAVRHWAAKAVYLASLTAFLALTVYVGARTSALGALGGWLTAWLVAGRGLSIRVPKLAVAGAVLVGAAVYASQDERLSRFSPDEFMDSSFTGRTAVWAEAVQDIKRHPFGVGMARAALAGDYQFATYSEHSTFLQAARSCGWIYGGLYVAAWAVIALGVARLLVTRAQDLPLVLGLALSLGAVCALEALALRNSAAFQVWGLLLGIASAHLQPVKQS